MKNLLQILVPDWTNNSWTCIENVGGERTCPGEFHIECPGPNAVPDEITDVLCSCDDQLIVNPTCREAFLCNE